MVEVERVTSLGIIPNWQFDAPAPRGRVDMMGLSEDGETVAYGGLIWFHSFLRIPSAIISGVHGYKRNGGDGGWAAVWGALGFLFPIITPVVALVQGFGKPAGGAR